MLVRPAFVSRQYFFMRGKCHRKIEEPILGHFVTEVHFVDYLPAKLAALLGFKLRIRISWLLYAKFFFHSLAMKTR
jgi:hypothetical protein